MKRFKNVIALLLTMVLVLAPFTTAAAGLLPSEGVSLSGYTVILHTNDTHGRAVPNSDSGYMGFTAVSALKQSYEKAGAEVILLDAGDTLHGLPFANLVKGESIVALMNLAGYDAMTPGNHDFNYGTDTLLTLAKSMKFSLLSSNVTNKANGGDTFKDHIILQKNGVRYGIFGLSTPETAYKTNPNNVTAVEFGNPIEAAKKEVEELKAKGADFIIALAHLGTDESSEFTSTDIAEQVTDIDLIVDGHSHSVYEEGLKVKDTVIVSTGDYIRNIGVVMIDSQGNMGADLIKASEFTGNDPAVDALAATYLAGQEELLAKVVGRTALELDGVREHVRAKETNLGNLTADAMRYVTGADVAFTNGGGIRATIPAGEITRKHIITVFPFGNYVVTKQITGEALLLALEHGASAYPETLGAFLQVSGVTFAIDPSKPAGNRVHDAKVNGIALDPKGQYLIATNDFVVAGGDGYTMLAEFPIVNEYDALENVIEEYLIAKGEIKTGLENRIRVLEAAAEATEAAGEQAEKTEEAVKDKAPVKEPEKALDYTVYVVKRGDYLIKIAREQLDKESQWKLIYEWNKDVIKNPDKIYIGQKIKLRTK